VLLAGLVVVFQGPLRRRMQQVGCALGTVMAHNAWGQ
jgi:hypothetical protein